MVESAFHSRGALALEVAPQRNQVAVMEPAGPVLEHENEAAAETPRTPRYMTALQQSLFALREAGKVVSIDGTETEAERKARRNQPVMQRRRQQQPTASYLPKQGVLEFVPMAAPQARKLATSVDARIYCEHQVASVTHRLVAGLYDLAFIGMLIMAFLGLAYWGCDDLAAALSDPLAAAVMCAAAAIIGLLYQSLFLAVRGETPGMQFAGLRLVDFDGRPTTESQLQMRILGAFFSVLPAGLGLLWALVDEESLTWQDHISHTFPTPAATE
jgi:uncharacterized RDD family membrane protein YckC